MSSNCQEKLHLEKLLFIVVYPIKWNRENTFSVQTRKAKYILYISKYFSKKIKKKQVAITAYKALKAIKIDTPPWYSIYVHFGIGKSLITVYLLLYVIVPPHPDHGQIS